MDGKVVRVNRENSRMKFYPGDGIPPAHRPQPLDVHGRERNPDAHVKIRVPGASSMKNAFAVKTSAILILAADFGPD